MGNQGIKKTKLDIRTLDKRRFYVKGRFDSRDFDYSKTRCTACGVKLPNLDATTLRWVAQTEDIHIFLCNRCENLQLDGLLYIEGLGYISMTEVLEKSQTYTYTGITREVWRPKYT